MAKDKNTPSQKDDLWLHFAAKYQAGDRDPSWSYHRSLVEEALVINMQTDELSEKTWLQAFILADADPKLIADLFGYSSVELVNAFEALFYDVRQYLKKMVYIFQYAIGDCMPSSIALKGNQYRPSTFIKIQGYREGVKFLLQMFPVRRNQEFEKTMRELATQQITANATMAAMIMDLRNPNIQMSLMSMLHDRNVLEKETETPEKISDALFNAVKQIGEDAGLDILTEDREEPHPVRVIDVGTDVTDDELKTLDDIDNLNALVKQDKKQ